MYGIFAYIYHKHQLNVGKYTIHGSCGYNSERYGLFSGIYENRASLEVNETDPVTQHFKSSP